MITITPATNTHRQAIINLLTENKLPVEDLPSSLDNFVIALDDDAIIGAAGLEAYGTFGLLRSVVVAQAYRNKQVASQLLAAIEGEAKVHAMQGIFLLTETAPQYFTKKGFETITRDEVPDAVKVSSEFSHVCPVSAVVMKKSIA